ncbi:MAG: potassium channel family protein [Planctomycetota bacterium]|jgi:trk system potassium uptake protein TrkA
MYVLIAGGGMVGGGLIRRLLDNKHDVVLVEQQKEICDKLYAETGVVAINGSVTNIRALTDADIRKADVVVAATGSDADNLACAILAKSFDVPSTIPEVRRITTIGGGKADIFIVNVPDGAKVAGKSIKDIVDSRHFPHQCTFVAVYDQQTEEFSIPRGKQIINEGNELFLISAAENIKKAVDFLTAKKRA